MQEILASCGQLQRAVTQAFVEDRDAGLEYPLGVPLQLLALLTCRANVGD
jgi:hypothetical protein